MKKTITTCVWASLTALLLSACGGKGFLGDRQDAVEGADAGGATVTSSADDADSDDATGADDSTGGADDANGQDDGDTQTGETPGADDADDGEDPAVDDAVDPDPATDDVDPADPTDDGEPGVDPINPDPVDPEPTDPEPTDPADPEYNPCEKLACGAECNSCPSNALCITGPGYCSAEGECTPQEPVCEPSEPSCPESCPIPKICQQCEGSDACAEPIIECKEDGSCGDILGWECPEPEPEPTVCPDECPVIEICKLCDDGSCAAPNVACNPDGSCGVVTFECADVACKVDTDCGEYTGEVSCVDCSASADDAADKPAFVPPEDPLPTSYQCTRLQCVEGVCKAKEPSCEYDPCEGKQDGDTCQLCPPDDATCGEIDVLKTCQAGKCEAAVGIAE